jgi:hypothetical protein
VTASLKKVCLEFLVKHVSQYSSTSLVSSLPLATPEANSSITNGEPSSAAVVNIASIVEKFKETGSPNLEAPKALCGRVSNVVIWEESHWKLVTSTLQPGNFIRLRNVEDRRWTEGNLRCKFQNWLWFF